MKIRILFVGKTQDSWLRLAMDEYLKRLKPLLNFEVNELPDTGLKETGSITIVKEREAETILKQIKPADFFVLLDETGIQKNSLEFSEFLTNIYITKRIVFCIGGVYGTSDAVKNRADLVLGLSRMTFTHQMTRLILIEQIYRAMMIAANRSYHY